MKIFNRYNTNWLTSFILITTQFHLLRNLTPLYYIFYAAALAISCVFFVRWLPQSTRQARLFFWMVFLLILYPIAPSIIGLAMGYYQSPDDSIFIGISRCIFVLPIYIAILIQPENNRNQTQNIVGVIIFISVIAALSIILQFLIGPISWFAESSARSGLPRYASLFGSLTAFGLVNGPAIILNYCFTRSKYLSSLFFVILIAGSILSLQKAAIVNMILATFFMAWIKRPSLKELVSYLLFTLMGGVAVAMLFYQQMIGYLSSIRVFEGDGSTTSDDFSIAESIQDRIITLPSSAIDFHGSSTLWLGLGPIGGSGAFGYPEIPMSHNGIVDLFLIGGIPYFLIFLTLCLCVSIVILKTTKKHTNFTSMIVGGFVVGIIVLNIPFSGLLFFTPSGALFLAAGLRLLCIRKS